MFDRDIQNRISMGKIAVEMLHGIIGNKNISREIKKNMNSSILRDITSCCPLKIQPVFQRNVSLPSSGSNKKPA
jgi:hypothetical protein